MFRNDSHKSVTTIKKIFYEFIDIYTSEVSHFSPKVSQFFYMGEGEEKFTQIIDSNLDQSCKRKSRGQHKNQKSSKSFLPTHHFSIRGSL